MAVQWDNRILWDFVDLRKISDREARPRGQEKVDAAENRCHGKGV